VRQRERGVELRMVRRDRRERGEVEDLGMFVTGEGLGQKV
jgi:hypothetical protein